MKIVIASDIHGSYACAEKLFCMIEKESADLLSEIKERAHVPLISKVADANSLLTPECYEVFEKDLSVSAIYHQLLTTRKGQPVKNDFTNQIIIL